MARAIDLVLDRIAVNTAQRQNLEDYMMSRENIMLKQPFRLPKIDYLTISDSAYSGALQLAHMVADCVKKCATGKLTTEEAKLVGFIKFVEFLGTKGPGEVETI